MKHQITKFNAYTHSILASFNIWPALTDRILATGKQRDRTAEVPLSTARLSFNASLTITNLQPATSGNQSLTVPSSWRSRPANKIGAAISNSRDNSCEFDMAGMESDGEGRKSWGYSNQSVEWSADVIGRAINRGQNGGQGRRMISKTFQFK